jgi:hypothetical protein
MLDQGATRYREGLARTSWTRSHVGGCPGRALVVPPCPRVRHLF